MRTKSTAYIRWSVLGILSVLSVCLTASLALALGPGAPPQITFAAAWVNTFSTNAYISTEEGTPQLYASLDVEIPGGGVPLNVASVRVTLPGGVTAFDMTESQNDLGAEISYFRNLTQAGVVGFPTGTYTFRVTDTAGGVTTVTDTLGTTTGLTPTTGMSMSGAVQVSPPPGVVFLLNLAGVPTPTVSWNAVPGAAHHRVRVRPSGGPDVFDRTFSPSTTSWTLPAGVMVPGRLYRVRVEADEAVSYLPATNARAVREIRVITQGPEIFLTFPSGTYTAGQTLDITTRIYNTGPSVTVNANAWVGLPTGGVIPILEVQDVVIPTNLAGDFYSGSIGFSYTFTGSEPSGVYVVGLRLTDPATGETVALTTRTFGK